MLENEGTSVLTVVSDNEYISSSSLGAFKEERHAMLENEETLVLPTVVSDNEYISSSSLGAFEGM